MDSYDLTKEQGRQINSTVAPMLNSLGRLKKRMYDRRFLPSDPILLQGEKAFDALQAVSVCSHYVSCGMHRRDRPKGNGSAG